MAMMRNKTQEKKKSIMIIYSGNKE